MLGNHLDPADWIADNIKGYRLMARLLLAVYLLTSMVGNGSLVLCEESDTSLSLESLLDKCCAADPEIGAARLDSRIAAGSDAPPSSEHYDCRDLSGGVLFAHFPRFNDLEGSLPALLPVVLPRTSNPEVAGILTVCVTRTMDRSSRLDFRGVGACPRILRT